MRRHSKRAPPAVARPAVDAWASREAERSRLRAQAAEARYEALTALLPGVTYVAPYDAQGAFTSISPQVERLLGFPRERWVREPRFWLSRLHPADRARVLGLLVRAHKGGRGFSAEYRLLGSDGRPRWVRDEARAARDAGGRALFIIGTWTEVTGRKARERERASQDLSLESSRAELTRFVSVVSHEFAAPLRRIIHLGERLRERARRGLDAESSELLERMAASATRLRELVSGLVRYAEQGSGPAAWTEVDLDRVLDQQLVELDEAAAREGLTLTRDPLPTVWSEPALLGRVLFNLLDNALKFRGPRPPAVHVGARRAGAQWIISVRDNGVGLDPRGAADVFSLFPGDARGMGLAVARKFVERLGGRIWAESEPGGGADFRFTLPVAPEEAGK